ncbi:hypothetical protein B0H14DRAFT_2716568 [Mycena olivaceomarginata]|nr:hypothetical protein B0H14DRAFT_2716568 [Mycena olivaceomarginata]
MTTSPLLQVQVQGTRFLPSVTGRGPDHDPNRSTNDRYTSLESFQIVSLRAVASLPEVLIILESPRLKDIGRISGATLVVSRDCLPTISERILTVSGPLHSVSKAFGLLVRLVNGEPFGSPSTPGSLAMTLDILLPHTSMGAVIGRRGFMIQTIEEISAAALIAHKETHRGSPERLLSVTGVADAIHIATYHIGKAINLPGPMQSAHTIWISTDIVSKAEVHITEAGRKSAAQIMLINPREIAEANDDGQSVILILGEPSDVQEAVTLLLH